MFVKEVTFWNHCPYVYKLAYRNDCGYLRVNGMSSFHLYDDYRVFYSIQLKDVGTKRKCCWLTNIYVFIKRNACGNTLAKIKVLTYKKNKILLQHLNRMAILKLSPDTTKRPTGIFLYAHVFKNNCSHLSAMNGFLGTLAWTHFNKN